MHATEQSSSTPTLPKPFIHVPGTVSPQAREYLQTLTDPQTIMAAPDPTDEASWHFGYQVFEAAQKPLVDATLKRYKPSVVKRKLGGVPVLDIKPKGWVDNGKALVYAHGGAYTLYSSRSTLALSVLVAHTTGLRVISIDYTVAPKGKWRLVTDEVLAVFKALTRRTYRMQDLAMFGDSAGGGLALGSVLKMRDRGLELPAAVVVWSPWADITNSGDSATTLKNAEPMYLYDKHLERAALSYADAADHKHPYVSPVYGDYSGGFPPTFIQGGTRELFLSHFVRLYQAMDVGGNIVKLDLHDGMTHNFQRSLQDAPEGKVALRKMTEFLRAHLGR